MKRIHRHEEDADNRLDNRAYGIAFILCGVLILLDAALIAHISSGGA